MADLRKNSGWLKRIGERVYKRGGEAVLVSRFQKYNSGTSLSLQSTACLSKYDLNIFKAKINPDIYYVANSWSDHVQEQKGFGEASYIMEY